MLFKALAAVRGTVAILAIVTVTLIGFVPLLPAALVKRLAWNERMRESAGRAAVAIALTWARAANAAVLAISGIQVSMRLDAAEAPGGRFVLLGNHLCAADPLFLVYALDRRFPFPIFCLKRSLRRLPVIGLAFWALDYIFVDRHSREAVRRNPKLRGSDTASIERGARCFRDHPVTIVNYPEGTRSTPAKRDAADSPYQTLLAPRTGAFRYAVRGLGPKLDGVLDLSIAYVDTPTPTLWALISGRIDRVALHLRCVDVPQEASAEPADEEARQADAVRDLLEARWAEKDAAIAAIQSPDHPKRDF